MLQKQILNMLSACETVVGSRHVIRQENTLMQTESATFQTTQKVWGVVRISDSKQLANCITIANQFKVPIHPISSGKNWGYGSSVPVRDAVIIDLSLMNRIIDFDNTLGCITLEPGVTQRQLHEFLTLQGHNWCMDATGSSPDCSIIGNTVERGFGHTPYADHFANICALQVLLPNGQLLSTGLSRFNNAKAESTYRWGLGPSLDGLFSQSNLGIVTQMTLWLMPKPEYFQAFTFNIEGNFNLAPLIDALRPLRLDGTIRSAVHIANDLKLFSTYQALSSSRLAAQELVSTEQLKSFRLAHSIGAWNGCGGLYGSRQQVKASQQRIAQALRGKVSNLRFIDSKKLNFYHKATSLYLRMTGKDWLWKIKNLQTLCALMQGVPTDKFIPSVYWRKQVLPQQLSDPDRDGCGLIWHSVVAPMTGDYARAMERICREVMHSHGFDPVMTMSLLSERSLTNVISISYDREVAGEDARAMACHRALEKSLTDAGFYPYRLGVQSMTSYASTHGCHDRLVDEIKRAVDPNHILSIGRYQPNENSIKDASSW